MVCTLLIHIIAVPLELLVPWQLYELTEAFVWSEIFVFIGHTVNISVLKMSFKLQARMRHLSGRFCEPYSSADFQDLNSVQPRLAASVVHYGSAWKRHKKLKVDFEEWFKLALLLKKHPALSPPMNMMLSWEPPGYKRGGVLLGGFGPRFDLLHSCRNDSTCIKERQQWFLQLHGCFPQTLCLLAAWNYPEFTAAVCSYLKNEA